MSPSRRQFLKLSVFAIVARRGLVYAASTMPAIPRDLDHILLGVKDLDRGIEWLEERSGVRAMRGGVHPGRGTRNALISFGSRRYLEIIAPDPAQATISNPMVDHLRALQHPRLVGWAEHAADLDAVWQTANAAGIGVEAPRDGSRARPDGKVLRWRSFNLKDDFSGLLPFFIQWSAESVHPSEDAPRGCSLQQFLIESPHVKDVSEAARKLGVDVEVRGNDAPRLEARIVGKKGAFELA